MQDWDPVLALLANMPSCGLFIWYDRVVKPASDFECRQSHPTHADRHLDCALRVRCACVVYAQKTAKENRNRKRVLGVNLRPVCIGRGGGIRTHDPLLPKQMRYQAALRPEDRHYTRFLAISRIVR